MSMVLVVLVLVSGRLVEDTGNGVHGVVVVYDELLLVLELVFNARARDAGRVGAADAELLLVEMLMMLAVSRAMTATDAAVGVTIPHSTLSERFWLV